MRSNVNIFVKMTHDTSGKDIDIGFLVSGTYVESIDLSGPKLLLVFKDREAYIVHHLQLKEYDEISVTFSDEWREEAVTIRETFVVLTCKPMPDGTIAVNAISKTVFQLKGIADKTRVFSGRGVQDVVAAYAGRLKRDVGQFAVVQNYHVIAGERPTTMLRQLAEEHGAHAWIARDTFHLRKFAELYKQAPAMVLHHAAINEPHAILSFQRPSKQMSLEESKMRSFTGWDEVKGRVKTSSSTPSLAKAKSTPPVITGVQSPYVLGNAPVTKKPVIDFLTLGTLRLTAGMALKLMWHTPDPENPLDEGMPDKIVVESVAHWYSTQKYYCRVKGAAILEPF